jgi:hypothetical protein
VRLGALVLIAACGGGQVASAPTAPAPAPGNTGGDDAAPRVILEMATTHCMGRCPIYGVELYDDGTLVFVGRENVAWSGEKRAALGRAIAREVWRAIEAAQFFELDDDGDPEEECVTDATTGVTHCPGSVGCSDTSHTIVTVHAPDRSRTIEDMHCEDTVLSRLEQRLIALLRIQPWIGD